MEKVSISKLEYKGWPNCIKITNGSIDLIATTDVGPRIIYFGYSGLRNELFELEEDIGKIGGDSYRLYGGHRLWHAPQDNVRTCERDNGPISWSEDGVKLYLSQPTEPWTMIKKDIEITMSLHADEVRILHRLTNQGAWESEFALWASTLLAPGGLEIVPLSKRDTNLAPNRTIALWTWTHMRDPKLYWGDKYVLIKQQNLSGKPRFTGPINSDEPWGCWTNPIKLGFNNEEGWAAYVNDGNMFVKKYQHITDAVYVDCNSSYETFCCDYTTEMETLSPFKKVKPGSFIEHTEVWQLHKDVKTPQNEIEVEKLFQNL